MGNDHFVSGVQYVNVEFKGYEVGSGVPYVECAKHGVTLGTPIDVNNRVFCSRCWESGVELVEAPADAARSSSGASISMGCHVAEDPPCDLCAEHDDFISKKLAEEIAEEEDEEILAGVRRFFSVSSDLWPASSDEKEPVKPVQAPRLAGTAPEPEERTNVAIQSENSAMILAQDRLFVREILAIENGDTEELKRIINKYSGKISFKDKFFPSPACRVIGCFNKGTHRFEDGTFECDAHRELHDVVEEAVDRADLSKIERLELRKHDTMSAALLEGLSGLLSRGERDAAVAQLMGMRMEAAIALSARLSVWFPWFADYLVRYAWPEEHEK